MQYFMLISAAFLLATDFAMNSIYRKLRGASPEASLFFNMISGAVTSVIFFAVNGFKLSFSLYSALAAILMSAAVMSYNMIGFRILKQASMSVYSLFLMTGGMVLPYIWGVLFLDEPLSIVKTIGLVIIISGVFLSNYSSKKTNIKLICMCLAVFLLNGFVSIISKMHQIETAHRCVSALEFIILGGIFKFLIAGALFMVLKNRSRQDSQRNENSGPSKALLVIVASALIGGCSYFFQLYGAKSLPATVLYPFITGGSIFFSALIDILLFRARISRRLCISVMLCFTGTVMFVL